MVLEVTHVNHFELIKGYKLRNSYFFFSKLIHYISGIINITIFMYRGVVRYNKNVSFIMTEHDLVRYVLLMESYIICFCFRIYKTVT